MKDLFYVFFSGLGLISGVIFGIFMTFGILASFSEGSSNNSRSGFSGILGALLLWGILTLVLLTIGFFEFRSNFYKVTYYPSKNLVCFSFLNRDLCVKPEDITHVKIYSRKFKSARTRRVKYRIRVSIRGHGDIYPYSIMISNKAMREMYYFIRDLMDNPKKFKHKIKKLICQEGGL